MKKPVLLMQKELTSNLEIIALNNLNINYSFSRIGLENSLIIPRYGLLPFYKEMERDANKLGSSLINSFEMHNYIANFDYYQDICDFTPKTYFALNEIYNKSGPFILKGATNSKKDLWNSQMYASNYAEAQSIYFKLLEDKMIQSQNIIFRQYIPLEILEYGINGLPFANEWRFFFYKKQLLSYGYYWSIAEKKGLIDDNGITFAQKIADIISDKINFFVIDIAKTQQGDWIVIEANDGCMSGLSDNNPEQMYLNLIKSCSPPIK